MLAEDVASALASEACKTMSEVVYFCELLLTSGTPRGVDRSLENQVRLRLIIILKVIEANRCGKIILLLLNNTCNPVL